MAQVGFTGTRNGMTEVQKQEVFKELSKYTVMREVHYFHHGDCIGADVEAASIARKLGFKIVRHPPLSDELRAFSEFDIDREPLTHFARNRAIVNEAHDMIACPLDYERQTNGGTWYTVDYSYKKGKIPTVILPDGSLWRR